MHEKDGNWNQSAIVYTIYKCWNNLQVKDKLQLSKKCTSVETFYTCRNNLKV